MMCVSKLTAKRRKTLFEYGDPVFGHEIPMMSDGPKFTSMSLSNIVDNINIRIGLSSSVLAETVGSDTTVWFEAEIG